MITYIRLEPLLRVIRNITGVKSQQCRMLVSGGAYYLIVKDKDSEAETSYRISEMTELGLEFIQFELTKEALVYIGDFGLKPAANIHLEIERKEEYVTIGIEGYEGTFECQYILWDEKIPEDYMEAVQCEISNLRVAFELYQSANSIDSLVFLDKQIYALSPELDSVFICERLCLNLDSQLDDLRLWLNSPKFWYNCWQKFKLEGDKSSIYSSGLYNLLCANFTVKLTSKEVVYGQIFYKYKKVIDKWHIISSIEAIYEKLLSADIVQLTQERIERQQRMIEAKQLKDTDLMLFRGDTKISVESFKKYILGQMNELTEARVDGNIVLVRTATHDTIFTLHEKVEAKGKVFDE